MTEREAARLVASLDGREALVLLQFLARLHRLDEVAVAETVYALDVERTQRRAA